MGIDPTKIQIVRSCLEASFKDVRSDKLDECFVFNDGEQSSQLAFDRAFLDDIPTDQLDPYLETNIVPKLKANPGMKIYVSNDGIEIMNRDLI